MNTVTLTDLRRRPHTSISAVREWLTCPRRYRLKYELRVEPAFRAAALAFGTAWHATIGDWLSQPELSIEELRAHLRDGLVARLREDSANVLFDDEGDDEGTLTDAALSMLEVFIAKVQRPDQVLGVEVPFQIQLAHPVDCRVLDVPIVGALDAIVVEGGKSVVWELKTAKKKWSADQLEFDLQTTAYGIAARQLGHRDARLELLVTTKTKTPDVQRQAIARMRGDEEELAEVVVGVHRAFASGVDYPVRGWQCRSCPFAGACRP